MIYQHPSYRSFLREVLQRRSEKNPSYSLRAMARDVGLLPSHLSALLLGKRGLSATSAEKVAERLALPPDEREYFSLLVQYEQTGAPSLKERLEARLRRLNPDGAPRDLSLDLFRTIADWYHIPILLLSDLAEFQPKPDYVAARLGITQREAQDALDRLKRMELLVEDSEGRWKRSIDNVMFRAEKPHAALRRFHQEMLRKAADALDTQSPEERHVGSDSMTIPLERLPKAREMIDRFRREFMAAMTEPLKSTGPAPSAGSPATQVPQEVYQLDTVFFRVSLPLEQEKPR